MVAPTSKGGSLPLVRTSLLSTPSPKGPALKNPGSTMWNVKCGMCNAM